MVESMQELIDQVTYGISRRFNCPCCYGVNSLSVTNENGVVQWDCYKADCKNRGKKETVSTPEELKNRLTRVVNNDIKFTPPDYWVYGIASGECLSYLFKYNCLEAYKKQLFKIAFDPKQNRIVFIIQQDNEVIGAVGRTLTNGKPKSLNYHVTGNPFVVGLGRIAALVEDCASACSIARFSDFTGIALLGTDIKENILPLLGNYDEVWIALDRDARSKAIKIKTLLDYYHTNIRIIHIHQDFKDMNKHELEDFLNEVKNVT